MIHFSGIRADLCVDVSVRLEHMLNVGIDSTFVTLSRVLVYIAVLSDEAARTDFTRTLTRDWIHTLHMAGTVYVAGGCLYLLQ